MNAILTFSILLISIFCMQAHADTIGLERGHGQELQSQTTTVVVYVFASSRKLSLLDFATNSGVFALSQPGFLEMHFAQSGAMAMRHPDRIQYFAPKPSSSPFQVETIVAQPAVDSIDHSSVHLQLSANNLPPAPLQARSAPAPLPWPLLPSTGQPHAPHQPQAWGATLEVQTNDPKMHRVMVSVSNASYENIAQQVERGLSTKDKTPTVHSPMLAQQPILLGRIDLGFKAFVLFIAGGVLVGVLSYRFLRKH